MSTKHPASAEADRIEQGGPAPCLDTLFKMLAEACTSNDDGDKD